MVLLMHMYKLTDKNYSNHDIMVNTYSINVDLI